MSKGRRNISAEDRAIFWQAIQSGVTIKEAARMAGIAYETALKWKARSAQTAGEIEIAKLEGLNPHSGHMLKKDLVEMKNLPPVLPAARLSPRAQKGLEDFDFFRRIYLGRVPSPWQVDAAYQIVAMLESPDKQFLVLNCPPGAGKSTLFHDVAVWCIVRNRAVRVMIGSISQTLAKMYSRRIRETLERVTPLKPDPEMVKRKLAVNAEACLALDYGRFKPNYMGALWRAEEFIVEQLTSSGLDNKEPTVSAYGIESEFIGHRADLCLFDDVVSPENAKESVARDKLLERWDSMAEARVDPGGVLAVIGQRLGANDLYAHCLSKVTYDLDDEYDGNDAQPEDLEKEPVKTSKYHHLVYRAYYEELDTGPESRRFNSRPWPDGPLLEPYRLSWRDLSYVRHNSPEKFAVVYQQEDMAEGTYLCDRVWATGGMGADGVIYPGCIDHDRRPGYIPPGLTPPVISIAAVDPSPTQFWALQWWLYQPETKLRYLVDLERLKLSAEELLGYDVQSNDYMGMMEYWQLRSFEMGYPISHWIVEINAAQRFLLAHDFVRKWQALHGVQIVAHTTSRNKLDENLGVEGLLPPLWRAGQVRLPTMRENWKTLAFVDEMTSWSRNKKHGTDLVMAHWFAELHMPQLSGFKNPPRMWRPSWLNV
jgi:transposase-like protein